MSLSCLHATRQTRTVLVQQGSRTRTLELAFLLCCCVYARLTCCSAADLKCEHCRCWHWMLSTQPSSTCRSTTSAAWSTLKALWCAVRRPGLCMNQSVTFRGPRLFVMLPAMTVLVPPQYNAVIAPLQQPQLFATSLLRQAKGVHDQQDCQSMLCDLRSDMHQSVGGVCRRSAIVRAARHGQDYARQGGNRTWNAAATCSSVQACCCLALGSAACSTRLTDVAGAQALARQSGACFINVRASTLQSKWFGDTQKLVQATFTLAYKIQPCIIFIGRRCGCPVFGCGSMPVTAHACGAVSNCDLSVEVDACSEAGLQATTREVATCQQLGRKEFTAWSQTRSMRCWGGGGIMSTRR